MNHRRSSAPPDEMNDLLRSALATDAAPDVALLAQTRRQMRSAQPKRSHALLWLAAAGGTAMTAALVLALTVLFPNPPWKQIVEALGGLCCACTWLLTTLSIKMVPAQQERMSLWQF